MKILRIRAAAVDEPPIGRLCHSEIVIGTSYRRAIDTFSLAHPDAPTA
ncbi:hypothetical protein [Sphingomonas sp. PP-F2F-G114-C0414]|nr:hypothetical protein [Sphingomonas sp. PP-F2F-G114-C0414]